MKKKIINCILVSMTTILLAGCGNKIPEMDETSRKMVVEYAADVVREHDLRRASRLMEVDALQAALEEEARLEAVFTKDYSTEMKEEESDSEEASNNEEKENNNGSEETEIVKIPLSEALSLTDTEITYKGYEVVKSYPQDSENVYFTMDATAGNDLIVLEFDITNKAQSDKTYDILSQKVHFKIIVDGESKNALTTMLLNDLSNYMGTIPSGTTEQLVLACEVPEEKAKSITEVALSMKASDGTIAIALE